MYELREAVLEVLGDHEVMQWKFCLRHFLSP